MSDSISTLKATVLLDNSTLSECFQIKPGVKQKHWCILSSIPFPVLVDWTIRRTISDNQEDFHGTFFFLI